MKLIFCLWVKQGQINSSISRLTENVAHSCTNCTALPLKNRYLSHFSFLHYVFVVRHQNINTHLLYVQTYLAIKLILIQLCIQKNGKHLLLSSVLYHCKLKRQRTTTSGCGDFVTIYFVRTPKKASLICFICIINCTTVFLSASTNLETILLFIWTLFLILLHTIQVNGAIVCLIKPLEHCNLKPCTVSLCSPSARRCFQNQLTEVKPVDDRIRTTKQPWSDCFTTQS